GEAVARYAEHPDLAALEFRVLVAEVDAFGRAARRVVLRIEIEHERRAGELVSRDRAAARRLRLERGNLLADFRCRHAPARSRLLDRLHDRVDVQLIAEIHELLTQAGD